MKRYNVQRMVSNDWTIQVLVKLRKLVVGGYLSGFVGWKYDDENKRAEENKALLYLKSIGVIDVSTILQDEFFEDGNGVLVTGEQHFGAEDMTMADPSGYAAIHKLDKRAYEQACYDAGLSPHKLTYRAKLELIDGVEPTVIIGGDKYILPTLHSGKPTSVIAYASTHPNTVLNKKALADIKPPSNIKFSIRDNIFSYNGGTLRHFIKATPDSIRFIEYADITDQELDDIKAKAKR